MLRTTYLIILQGKQGSQIELFPIHSKVLQTPLFLRFYAHSYLVTLFSKNPKKLQN